MQIFSASRMFIIALTMATLGFIGVAQAQTNTTDTPSGAATGVDQTLCMICHKDVGDSLAMTTHGVTGDSRTPFGSGKACQSCHSNAEKHLENPMQEKPLTFDRTTDSHARSAPCESCHEGKTRMHWVGSSHERSDVACNDCHNIHKGEAEVLVPETQAGVCFDCHKDVRASSMRASAHPIKTGEMACSSCHQPHGSVGESNLVKATVNETCFTCHADKRGPFLWPHAPAVENCDNCHEPHGSNHRPMLTARGPFLCQECHSLAHAGGVFSGNQLPPATGGDKFVGQNCMNCHSKVHGSNHPSGARFTR